MSKDLNHRDDFDKLIASSFAEQPVQADPVVWDNIAAAIAPQKTRVIAWWWYGAAASVALLATAAIFFMKDDPASMKDIPAVTFDEGATDQKAGNTQIEIPSETINEAEGLSFENETKSGESNQDQNVVDFDKASMDQGAIASSESNAKDSENRLKPSSSNNLNDKPFTEKSAGSGLIASEKRGATPLKNGIDRFENGAELGSIVQHSSDDKFTLSSEHSQVADLDLMPRLGAELPLEFATVDQLENRFMPWYDDSYPQNLESESSNFLAANLTSGGSASAGLTSGASRFAMADNATPTELVVGNNDEYSFASDEEVNYSPPFVLGVKGALGLSKRWYIESGLNYTYLSQKITSELGFVYPTTIVEHYIGVPLLFDFEFVQKRKLSMLASTGWQIEKGIASRSSVEEPNGTTVTKLQTPGIQLGWVVGLATEYRINQQAGIYMQPSITYWMYSSAGIQNVRNESLIWPSLQMGLRYRIN